MSIITMFSGSFCEEGPVVREIISRTGYRHIIDDEIVAEASRRSGLAENKISRDRFYQFLEKTWMWQQLPVALFLFLIGNLEWVIWGVCLRVAVSVSGHWLIGFFAHNTGHRDWHVEGAAVQGFNIRFCGLITMGECWHNNHHAYPGSALLGINPDQVDPGWWVLMVLQKLGLVWNIKKPEDLAERPELIALHQDRQFMLQE